MLDLKRKECGAETGDRTRGFNNAMQGSYQLGECHNYEYKNVIFTGPNIQQLKWCACNKYISLR